MEKHNEDLLRKYIDGDLTPEEEQEALHMIADDEEMRSMLRFEQMFNHTSSSLGFLDNSEVPSGFSDQVMSIIADETEEEAVTSQSIGLVTRIRAFLDTILEPKQVQLRPVYAMAIMLVFIVTIGIPYFGNQQNEQQPLAVEQSTTSDGATIQSVSDNGEQVWTRFVYIDKEAESVSVAGDFSNWEPIELTKKQLNGEQVWTGLIPMDRGEHRYMFVKNGEHWVTDPLATVQQDDGFGNKNAVIYL
jgi:hypothetical protein